MKKLNLFSLCIILFPVLLVAQTWEMKQAPIMTTWSAEITPENVHQEYPRPQFVRENWMNLNGVWEFKFSNTAEAYADATVFDKRILVPFPIESAISGVKDEGYKNWSPRRFFYKKKFTIPESMQGKDILLHFGAVDWQAEVWVNGVKIGMHQGGYDPFYFNITSALNPTGEQTIALKVADWDNTSNGIGLCGKQSKTPGGVFYTPVTGIWQTVWIEPVAPTYIQKYEIIPDLDNSSVKIVLDNNQTTTTNPVNIRVYDKGILVASAQGVTGTEVSIPVSNPKLWSPDSPFLYNLEFDLLADNVVIDLAKSYFGMRKVSKAVVNGIQCMMLNNKPIFNFGVLDQGWWPDGLYTAPSDEALAFDLIKTKEFGFNMTRKHIKVEPARWFYLCDSLGLMVWQDIPGGSKDAVFTQGNAAFQANYLHEASNIINAYKNSPSVVTWVLFNEGWSQFKDTVAGKSLTTAAYEMAKPLIKNSLINVASGWTDYRLGDFIDKHTYPSPGMWPHPTNQRIEVCGEYGGITLTVADHMWGGNDMVYTSVKDGEELTTRFEQYANGVMGLQSNKLVGAIYTQLTDVEKELNGLITYDRKIIKTNSTQTARVKYAIENNIINTCTEIVPTARNSAGNQWKYNTSLNNEWNTIGYDDSTWSNGVAGFGNGNVPNSNIRTTWNTPTIYMRRMFNFGNLTDGQIGNLNMMVFYDEDFQVYINGVLAASATGFTKDYSQFVISDEARATIKSNQDNLVAVKCSQTSGGQYIDLGFTAVVPRTNVGTGLNEANYSNTVEVYPNPTGGNFIIKSNGLKIQKVNVCDLTGKSVKIFNTFQSVYDVKDLVKGIYLIHVNSEGRKFNSKIVLQ